MAGAMGTAPHGALVRAQTYRPAASFAVLSGTEQKERVDRGAARGLSTARRSRRGPRYSGIDAHPSELHPWPLSFDPIASVATRICRRTRQTREFALSNAHSAPPVSRPHCAMSARIAAADLRRARFDQRRNGGLACRSKSARHRPSACACHTASKRSLPSRSGSKILRQRIARTARQ
jgi:hypothetical protein